MITFSKTMTPLDYGESGMGLWVYAFDAAVEARAIPYMPNPHIHRRWEYGMAMEFLKFLGGTEQVKTVLDVGGAGSLFAPIAMTMGYHVTVVDPDPCVYMMAGQIRSGGGSGVAICASFEDWGTSQENGVHSVEVFDAVVSLSTVEHIENDVAFVEKLARHAERGLFLTTDFSLDGLAHQPGHLRTYTPKTMQNKLAAAVPSGWEYAGEPDWSDRGNFVFDYSFASLGMVANASLGMVAK